MSKKNISNKRCYLCKKQTIQSGYLMTCSDGSCGCAPGTQPWGCGAGQKPMCKSIDEINIMRKAQA